MNATSTPMLKRSWLWTPLLLGLLAVASYVAYRWLSPPQLQPGLLYGNGRIEGTEVMVSSEVAARAVESALVEGNSVRQGQTLIRLDDTDIRTQLERVQSQREAAMRERERLQRELVTAEHHLHNAEVDDRRYAGLARSGAIPGQRREQASNVLAETQGRVATLRTALEESDAKLEALGKSVQLAQSQLDKTLITAPIAGTILTKSIEVGELATPGRPIATLVDLTRVDLKIYIPERDIGKIHLGDEARARTDAFPERYIPARVARIDPQAQFTPRDVHMPDERVRQVFGVTLALENPRNELRPGMPADAWVKWDRDMPWPEHPVVPR